MWYIKSILLYIRQNSVYQGIFENGVDICIKLTIIFNVVLRHAFVLLVNGNFKSHRLSSLGLPHASEYTFHRSFSLK